MSINELKTKWQQNVEMYGEQEVGSGVHSFVRDVLRSPELLNLNETAKKTAKFGTFIHDSEQKKEGRPDFILYICDDVTIPVEVKCFGRITKGINQLRRYQLDYSKQFGILTDGNEWRFYRATSYIKFTLDQIFKNTDDFLAFWNDYIKPENYYIEFFNPTEKSLFDEKLDLNDAENRKIFFEDTTNLIRKFRIKLKTLNILNLETEKQEVETAYSYLIQFILYKVLVDSNFKKFISEYQKMLRIIKKSILDSDFYNVIVKDIRDISEYISKNIYKPFVQEQLTINQKLAETLKNDLTIDEIAPWLDVIIFIDKYNFGNLKNEIFGFIYENYLKDLFQNENRGQYFTDPAVVNYMLDIADFTTENIRKNPEKLSLIDPSCGAGTFLYSAVDRIINAFFENKIPKTEAQKKLLQENAQKIEKLVSKNIFGMDIEEFPLYLAEMNILMRLLPLIINDNFENPIDDKIKIFKTKDSISEFLDAEIGAINPEIDFPMLFSKNELGYKSFMRDNNNLQEMIESMQGTNGERLRFDFVFGNPPYIGYNECSKQNMQFVRRLQDKNDHSISMGNVYGVNLNTVPNRRKPYSPKPNLYAFFTALSFSLLKKNGKICFIIPQTMLTAGDLDVLRYYLAKFTTIEKLATFEGNLFIDRGLNENKPVATSSLIFVATKNTPDKNHQVEIINFKPYFEKKGESFKDYFKGKHRKTAKTILQTKLLENIDNWNFIKSDKKTLHFEKKYAKNSISIEDYRKNVLADYDEMQFDKGLVFDKNNINKEQENWFLFQKAKKQFILQLDGNFIATKFLRLPEGSQGLQIFENQNKIIWRYMNPDKFYFSDEKIMIDFNWVIISSNNKNEILYLLSLLNSKISKKILNSRLKTRNEQALLLGIKSIKQYIRIPKITPENQPIKDKIIFLTEKMLDLEKVALKDLADFSDLMIQRFENVQVVGNNLVLTFNNKDYRQKIAKEKTNFVKKLISEKFYDNGLIFNRSEVTLQELQNLEAIDFQEQEKLKNHIDNLVFALYFEVNLLENQLDNIDFVQKECEQNEFYN
ncbi:MAG: Eco57I restriction-modification methylase domain-containing protein [Prevotellaceae bacterium]|jgi:hypothetical protein|nr:Eco57I restriction-modification methylase domain-containing protein [Prevotellaceae bacterium]